MTPRKSPYKHPVRGHTRDGHKVTSYVRGEGDPPTANPGKNNPQRGNGFIVSFSFPDAPKEVVSVNARTFTDAVRAATGRFRTPLIPVRVRVGKV